MSKELIKNFILKGTDWLFRASKLESFLVRSGIALIVLSLGPQLLELFLKISSEDLYRDFESIHDTLEKAKLGVLSLGVCLVIVGLYIAVTKHWEKKKSNSRKQLIVVEGRGLQNDDGVSLTEVIKENNIGHIISVLLDLRSGDQGLIKDPKLAIRKIHAWHMALEQHKKSFERSDITVFYGGLTSVPYTFLTGLLIDDEGSIVTYDWDREEETWRLLDDEDDDIGFDVRGLDLVGNTDSVVVALAYSYPILDEDLASTFSDPVVRIDFNGKFSSDAHWSQVKQSRLAQQFFEVIKCLSASGVQQIHLVMAAPNSVVFNFGRRYDKRNLPKVTVYQYERNQSPAYPWGVMMPVNESQDAEVTFSHKTKE